MPSLSTFILQLNMCHQLRYSLLFIFFFFDVTYPVNSNRLLTTKAKWQTEHCHWRRLSHRGHTVTCHLFARISWYFSYLSCCLKGCWSDLFCFWAVIFAIFKIQPLFPTFETVNTWPASTAVLVSLLCSFSMTLIGGCVSSEHGTF